MLKHGKKCLIKKYQLTDTAQNFFHLLEQFAKLKKTHCINTLILENQIQDLPTSTCGHFQLHFYKNLLDPDEKSKIITHKTLNKSTLQTIMNEIFSTDIKEKNLFLQNKYFCFNNNFFILLKKKFKRKKIFKIKI